MITVVTIYYINFKQQFTSTEPVFTRQNNFKKLRGKMFIERIIECELRDPGPTGRTCNVKTAYFYGKTKIFKENKFSSELLLTAKYFAGSSITCFPSPGSSQFQNLSKNATF